MFNGPYEIGVPVIITYNLNYKNLQFKMFDKYVNKKLRCLYHISHRVSLMYSLKNIVMYDI